MLLSIILINSKRDFLKLTKILCIFKILYKIHVKFQNTKYFAKNIMTDIRMLDLNDYLRNLPYPTTQGNKLHKY